MLKFQRSQDLYELIPPAHAEPSVASFFKSAPVRGSVVNLLTRLADRLIREESSVQVHPSGRQAPWSRRSDLIMEIVCSGSATVWTLG
jgi:hypothetical protein